MKRLDYKILLLFIFMSFTLPGGKTEAVEPTTRLSREESQEIQDSLYLERIKNINRLEQMKYVVHKMAE